RRCGAATGARAPPRPRAARGAPRLRRATWPTSLATKCYFLHLMPGRAFSFALAATCLVAAAASCSSKGGTSNGKPKTTNPDGGGYGDGINDSGHGAGSGAATGLPCAVQEVLENRCIGCHLAGSTIPLLSYDDLMKPAPSEPSVNLA